MPSKSFADILAERQTVQDRKVAEKLPSWAGVQGLSFPTSLCLEQCSSEATAAYKAGIAEALGAQTIADLTGGLGVDCRAFAQKAREVWHNEMNEELSRAVQGNFALMGIENIHCSCAEATLTLAALPQVDMIYMDPARRSATGKKVFLLEDCSPNVLEMMPDIWQKTSTLMLKLSPMADISMLASRLGRTLSEVHVVGSAGEVKELLCVLRRGHDGDFDIIATDLRDCMRMSASQASEAKASYAIPEPGMILFEPSPVLMKAGFFNALGLPRLAPSTHLYLAAEPQHFGRNWRIGEVLPFGKAEIKALGKRLPRCEVTARNLPLSSDELRKKMGSASGGQAHVFGASGMDARYLLVCESAQAVTLP